MPVVLSLPRLMVAAVRRLLQHVPADGKLGKEQFVELYGEPKVSGIQKPRVNGATAHSAGQAAKRRRPGYSVKNIQSPVITG